MCSHLAEAIDRLLCAQLEYVGISERLEESLHLFCWQFCLPCMNQTDELRTLLSYQINVQRSGYLTPRPFTKVRPGSKVPCIQACMLS